MSVEKSALPLQESLLGRLILRYHQSFKDATFFSLRFVFFWIKDILTVFLAMFTPPRSAPYNRARVLTLGIFESLLFFFLTHSSGNRCTLSGAYTAVWSSPTKGHTLRHACFLAFKEKHFVNVLISILIISQNKPFSSVPWYSFENSGIKKFNNSTYFVSDNNELLNFQKLRISTTATATRTPQNKKFNEQNNGCARAL